MDSLSRYIFIFNNVIFMILGLLLLSLSLWLQCSSPIHEILSVDHSSRVIINTVLILGCFTIAIGLCGMLGGILKNTKFLAVYFMVNVAILIIALVMFICGLVNQDLLKEEVSSVWKSLHDETKFVVQEKFKCCGFFNASEWNGVYDASCLNSSAAANTSVTWSLGCFESILSWIEENALSFGSTVGLLFFFLVLQTGISAYQIARLRKGWKAPRFNEVLTGSPIDQQNGKTEDEPVIEKQ